MPDSFGETPTDRAGQAKTYGGYTLDELRLMHEAATPAPWQEYAESGDWWVAGGEDDKPEDQGFVCSSNTPDVWAKQADIDLTVALRNAFLGLRAALDAAEAQTREAKEENARLRTALAKIPAVCKHASDYGYFADGTTEQQAAYKAYHQVLDDIYQLTRLDRDSAALGGDEG